MRIEKEVKLAVVIHHDFDLIPVINRFGIQLGFGDGTIEDICKKKKVNTEFFLSIINTYHDPQYFPKKHLLSYPASTLILYLQKAHQYYLEQKIPEIKSLISQLTELAKHDKDNYQLAWDFFDEYHKELLNHIEREENVVYPYVWELEQTIEKGTISDDLLTKLETYSISVYEEDHDDVEEKLYDLKNLIIKYL